MTIAMGFHCRDGIVLCSDSLESNGTTKRIVPKIWSYEVGEDWGIAIASAGDGDLADSFNEKLYETLGNSDFDEVRLLAKLRTSISQVRDDYPFEDFGMLIGIYHTQPHPESKLYRVYGRHLGPVKTYQSIGTGSAVADLICSQIYTSLFTVEEAQRLGILAIARVKENVEGCDGPTRVISYTRGAQDWNIPLESKVTEIEKEFGQDEFRSHLQEYWVKKNPVSSWPGGYRWVHSPPVRWRKSAKLNTKD